MWASEKTMTAKIFRIGSDRIRLVKGGGEVRRTERFFESEKEQCDLSRLTAPQTFWLARGRAIRSTFASVDPTVRSPSCHG